jgi:hypothetical protein
VLGNDCKLKSSHSQLRMVRKNAWVSSASKSPPSLPSLSQSKNCNSFCATCSSRKGLCICMGLYYKLLKFKNHSNFTVHFKIKWNHLRTKPMLCWEWSKFSYWVCAKQEQLSLSQMSVSFSSKRYITLGKNKRIQTECQQHLHAHLLAKKSVTYSFIKVLKQKPAPSHGRAPSEVHQKSSD